MAGRGRGGAGRGRTMSFSVETLGFGRGEALPGPILEPPPLYPPLEFKPVPLEGGEQYDYMLALKQELRATMRDSPYFINPPEKKSDIIRYSDKYKTSQQENTITWQPDWSRLPSELKIKVQKKKRLKAVIQPKLNAIRRGLGEDMDIGRTLEELEKKETTTEGEVEEEDEAKKEEEEENVGDDDEFYDEDDMEDETDYNLTYFDNGENYGVDEDDDLDDGPIY